MCNVTRERALEPPAYSAKVTDVLPFDDNLMTTTSATAVGITLGDLSQDCAGSPDRRPRSFGLLWVRSSSRNVCGPASARRRLNPSRENEGVASLDV